MRKITGLLLGMIFFATIVSCTNNASGAKTSYAIVAVFKETTNPTGATRIKFYENNT